MKYIIRFLDFAFKISEKQQIYYEKLIHKAVSIVVIQISPSSFLALLKSL